MAYTVLARKYRPQTFVDLVGQEHVTRTLSNAIKTERVAHAFLFTGVRGVGKTTTARIFAKALNCERGPTPEPCGTCDICVSITDGRDTDVLEMDGASNNSVEDVRRLQESIPYRPTRDRFKVVIVDEVHMLSTGAFNAFLKTLEEPPEHVKFIFATTEAHKVPVTIRSRCQRYDFRLIPESVVSARVREILAAEGVEADDAAVAIVAREAAGSMRDALTLLDQIVAFGGAHLVGEEVAGLLGIADRDAVHRVGAAVVRGDGADVLRTVDELASRGLDMLHFARQLLGLFRDMVVLQVSGADTDLVSMVAEERQRAFDVGASVDLAELQRAFSALNRVVEDTAQSGAPRTALEMGLVRIATRPPLLPLAELIARFERLEARGGGGGGGGGGARPRGAPPSRGGGASPGARAAGSTSAPAAPSPDRARSAAAPADSTAPSRADTVHASAQAAETRVHAAPDHASPHRATAPTATSAPPPPPPTGEPRTDPGSSARHDDDAPPVAASAGLTPEGSAPEGSTPEGPAPEGSASAPSAPEVSTPPAAPREASTAPREASAPSVPAPSVAAPSGIESVAPPRPPLSAEDESPDEHESPWEALVATLMDTKPALGAVLKHGAPVTVSADRLEIAFPPKSFFAAQAEAGADAIADAAAPILGGRPTIEVTFESEGGAKTLAQVDRERRETRLAETKARALNHPLVREAATLFSIPESALQVRVELE